MSINKFLSKHAHDLSGKWVAISGSTGGLGGEVCKLLASSGANIILIDRNKAKQQKLIDGLLSQYPATKIESLIADMEDITSVKAVAESLIEHPLDVLILNAGAYSIPRHKTSTGYDNVYQINFLSPYYLARRLLPKLKENGGRVIVVGSIAHNYSKTDVGDIDFSTRQKASLVYGNAKRYLMYAMFDLALKGEPVVVTHPGISCTGITAHYPKWLYAIIKYPMKVIFMPPEKACLCIYDGIFEMPKAYCWIGPRVFDVWGLPSVKKLNTARESERKYIAGKAQELYEKLNNF